MLGIGHSSLNGGNIAAQVDGGGRCKIGAVGGVAGLIDGAILQLFDGLAHGEVAQGCSLSVPLGNCAAPGHHAVVLALFVLGLNLGGQVGGDDAGGVKVDGCADGIQTGGVDHALVVHQNGGQSHIVLGGALSFFGDGCALGNIGDHSQSGLQSGRLGGGAQCLVDQALEATDLDGDGRSQVGVGGLALLDCDASHISCGLAGDVLSEGSGLLVPFCNGAAPGHHAVALTQLVLGLNGCGQISGDVAGSVEGDLCLNSVEDTGSDDAVLGGNSGNIDVELCGAVALSGGVGGAVKSVDGGQDQLVAGLCAQMLSVGNSGFDGGNIASQIDGCGGGQVGAVGSVAGLIHGAILQLVNGLAHSVLAQSSSLSVPLSNGAAPGHHAVVLALFVLGLNRGGQVGGDDAGGVEVNGGADGVQTGGVDHTLVVHQNSGQSHIVLGGALSFFGDGNALGSIGDDGQAGLQCALFQDGLSLLGRTLHHNDGAHAAGQQGCNQQPDHDEHQVFLHNEFLHD